LICRSVRDFAGHRIEAGAVHRTLDVAAARKSGCNELKVRMGACAVEGMDAFCRARERNGASGDLDARDIIDAELIERDDINKELLAHAARPAQKNTLRLEPDRVV
jgi:hypothetical protein